MKFILRFITTMIALGLAVAGLVLLYTNTQKFTIAQEQQSIDTLNILGSLDTKWDSEVLRVNSGMSSNYDQLAKNETQVFNQLNLIKTFPVLAKNIDALETEIKKKSELVGNFKARNSTLKNSLEYAPIAYQNLLNQGNTLPEESIESMRELLSFILSYNQQVDETKKENITKGIDQLKTLLATENLSGSVLEQFNFFISHLSLIVVERPYINALLTDIEAINIDKNIDTIRNELNQQIKDKVAEQETSNNYLTYYAVFLLVLLVLFGIRLIINFIALNRANKALSTFNEELESRVDERTEELSKAMVELKNSEASLVQAEKMSSLGQLVAGVAHEINTPLAYAKSSFETIDSTIASSMLPEFLAHAESLIELIAKPEKKRSAQESTDLKVHFQNAFKMIKEMELNEISFSELLLDMRGLIEDGIYGINQISELINNLRNFSRLDKNRIASYNLREAIESALLLIKHEIKDKTVTKNYEEEFEIQCMPSQINQVLLNILTNANHAIKANGHINVTLRKMDDKFLAIEIQDDGYGIDEKNLSNIFDPFFTTKDVGEGTGLGLSICYKIIQEHGGTILVDSTLGQGTTFTIKLPIEFAPPSTPQ